ncbi:MAG TPA: electron transfer flavoprotein subunit alpha/FixB family protein, partial [Candidatus Aquilonibacter sp.]
MKNVLVFVAHKSGQTPKVTFEMATQARTLADQLGGKAHALVVGAGSTKLAQTLKTYPLDAVHVNDDADVDGFLLDPIVDYVESAARAIGPSLILIANTLTGKDVAGRVMARLGAGICADATDFKIEDGKVEAIMPKMGGAAITTCALRAGDYGVVTIRPNAFAAAAGGAGATVQAIDKPSGKNYTVVVEKDVEEGSGELALEEAPVVIAGGRGLGGPEPFESMLKPLAQAFGGAVGASRAAADAGWVPYNLQIGQT